MKHAEAKQIAELLAALAEPARLRILRLLEAEELSVGEVAKVVQLPQSTVSRHLKVLAETRLVARRAAGTATLYRLVLDDLTLEARSIWITIRSRLAQAPEVGEDRRRLAGVLAERRIDSQGFFGRVAGEWDQVRQNLFGADFTARALLALLARDWVVADLGCGTGNAAELLAPHVERIIAVDQSEPMLQAARQRITAPNVEFHAGRLERLPLADRSVDAVVCILVLHHIPEPPEALAEMRRVLRAERSGGVLLAVDMLAHERAEYRQTMGHAHLGFAPEAMARMLEHAGFAEPRLWLIPCDTAAKGPGLFAASARIGAPS